jgi:hypothetical protein
VLDGVNAIETPNYIPRHVLDITHRMLVRTTQDWMAGFIIDTTPSSYVIPDVTMENADLDT